MRNHTNRHKRIIKIIAIAVVCIFTFNNIASYAGPELFSSSRVMGNLQPVLMTWKTTNAGLAETAIAHYYRVLGPERLRRDSIHLYPIVNDERIDLFISPEKLKGDLTTVSCLVKGTTIEAELNLSNGYISFPDHIKEASYDAADDLELIEDAAQSVRDTSFDSTSQTSDDTKDNDSDNTPGSWFPDSYKWTANAWFTETFIPLIGSFILLGICSGIGLYFGVCEFSIFNFSEIPFLIRGLIAPIVSAMIFWTPHLGMGIKKACSKKILTLTGLTAIFSFFTYNGSYLALFFIVATMLTHYYGNLSSLKTIHIDWLEEEESLWEEDPRMGKRLQLEYKYNDYTASNKFLVPILSTDENMHSNRKQPGTLVLEEHLYRKHKKNVDLYKKVSSMPEQLQKEFILALIENITKLNGHAKASVTSLLMLDEAGLAEIRILLTNPDRKVRWLVADALFFEGMKISDEYFNHGRFIKKDDNPPETIGAMIKLIELEEKDTSENRAYDARELLSRYVSRIMFYGYRYDEDSKDKEDMEKTVKMLLKFASDKRNSRFIYFAMARDHNSIIQDEFITGGTTNEILGTIMGAMCLTRDHVTSGTYFSENREYVSPYREAIYTRENRLMNFALNTQNDPIARSYALELLSRVSRAGTSMEGFHVIYDVATSEIDPALRSYARHLVSKNLDRYIEQRKHAQKEIDTFGSVGKFVGGLLAFGIVMGWGLTFFAGGINILYCLFSFKSFIREVIEHGSLVSMALTIGSMLITGVTIPFLGILAKLAKVTIAKLDPDEPNKDPENKELDEPEDSPKNDPSEAYKYENTETDPSESSPEKQLPKTEKSEEEDEKPTVASLTKKDRRRGLMSLIKYAVKEVKKKKENRGVDFSGRNYRKARRRMVDENAQDLASRIRKYLKRSKGSRGREGSGQGGTSLEEMMPKIPDNLTEEQKEEMARRAAELLNSMTADTDSGGGGALSSKEIASMRRQLTEAMFSKGAPKTDEAFDPYEQFKTNPGYYSFLPGSEFNDKSEEFLQLNSQQTSGTVSIGNEKDGFREYDMSVSYMALGGLYVLELKDSNEKNAVAARMIYEFTDEGLAGHVLTIRNVYCRDYTSAFDLHRLVGGMVKKLRNEEVDFYLFAYNKVLKYVDSPNLHFNDSVTGIPSAPYSMRIRAYRDLPDVLTRQGDSIFLDVYPNYLNEEPYYEEEQSLPVKISDIATLLGAKPVESEDSTLVIDGATVNVEYKALLGESNIPVYITESVKKYGRDALPSNVTAFANKEGVFILKDRLITKIKLLQDRVERIGRSPITLEQLILSRIYPSSEFKNIFEKDRQIMIDVVNMVLFHELQHYIAEISEEEDFSENMDRVKGEEASFLAPVIFGTRPLAQLFLLAEMELEDIAQPHSEALKNIWERQQNIFHTPEERVFLSELLDEDKEYPEALRIAATVPEELLKAIFTRHYDNIPDTASKDTMKRVGKDLKRLISGEDEDDSEESASSPSDTSVLKDLSSSGELAQCVRELALSRAFDKKLVLAFNTDMALYQTGNPMQQVVEALEALKKKDGYNKLLENLVIVRGSTATLPTDLQEYLGDNNSRVFLFSDADEERKAALSSLEAQVNAVYIDDKEFKSSAYYPLAEIVVLTIAQHVEGIIAEGDLISTLQFSGTDFDLNSINIESVQLNGTSLIFKLLPSAEEMDTQKLIGKYAMLERFLEAA